MSSRHSVKRRRIHVSKRVVLRILGGLTVLALGAGLTVLLVDRRQDITAAAAPKNTVPAVASKPNSVRPTLSPTTPLPTTPLPTTPASTTPSPTPTPSDELVGSASDDNETFASLLAISGFDTSSEKMASYIRWSKTACGQLADGLSGQELLAQSRRSAGTNGLTEEQAEGLLYIGVATFCSGQSSQLP